MLTPPPLRALLIEDELHARRYLRELLSDEPGVAIVGEAATGGEGMALIKTLGPDLVFLDVQMPELDGLSMIERIGTAAMPAFVFVTAYAEYAVRAFEIEAVDYVCKPFDRQRLSAAVGRARRHLGDRGAPLEALLDPDRPSATRWLSRLTVKEADGITFVPVGDVLWIEAANKQVVIHTARATHLARLTIQEVASGLDPSEFVRIHRGTVVRKATVRGLHPLFHGDYTVTLRDGTQLTLSRTYREAFFDAMSR
jgi:two-component system LytT family response regulator